MAARSLKTSFQKKTGPVNTIAGTKSSIQNAQLIVSSGAPSFDRAVGEGLPVGSLVLIEEDRHSTYSKLLTKYFLSEGVVLSQSLFVGSKDVNPAQFVKGLPAPIQSTETKSIEDFDQKMTIAWRYQHQQVVQPTLGGNQFDLSNNMSPDVLSAADITYWTDDDPVTEETSDFSFSSTCYSSLLKQIRHKLQEDKFNLDVPSTNRSILRIALHSVGSPLWDNSSHLVRFLYELRALLRYSLGVCLITVPTFLLQPVTVSRCIHVCDIVVKLDSFTGTVNETNQALKEYHGFFRVVKTAAINTLVPHVQHTRDLVFKLRRKSMVIEKLHLPPEFGDTTEREQDEVGSLSCSGGKGASKLEF